MLKQIVQDMDFEEVAEVRTDSKNRITLTKRQEVTKIYKVYVNSLGQIILDPQVTIPAHERWLFKNKKAAELIKAGLTDAKKGKLVKAREDYSTYVDGR